MDPELPLRDLTEKQQEVASDLGSPFPVLDLKFAHLRGKGHPNRAGGNVYVAGMHTFKDRCRFWGSGRTFKRFSRAGATGEMEREARCVCRNRSGTHAAPSPSALSGLEQRPAGAAPGSAGRRAGRGGTWPRPQPLFFLSRPERESRGCVRVGGAAPREEAR